MFITLWDDLISAIFEFILSNALVIFEEVIKDHQG